MTLSPGLAGFGLLSAGCCAVDPAWGLWVLFASTMIEVRTDAASGLTVFASEVVFAITMAAWTAARGRGFLSDRRNRLLAGSVVLLLGSVAVSGLLSGARGDAVRGLLRWAEFAGVLVMAADAGDRGVFPRRVVVLGLALVAAVLSVHALADAAPWMVRLDNHPERIVFRLPGGMVVWRAAGLEHPNVLAASLFPCAGVCAAAWVSLPLSALSAAAGLTSALASSTIVLTYSRGGLLGLAAIMAAILASAAWAPFPRRAAVRLAGLLALAALAVRLLGAPEALAEQTRSVRATASKMAGIARGHSEGKRLMDDLAGEVSQAGMAVGSLNDRKLMAETAGRMVRARPWLGLGPGGWLRKAEDFASSGMTPAGLEHHPHNLYLLILCDCGILGLAAFVLVVVALVRGANWGGTWPLPSFQCAWAGVLTGFLAVSAFDVPLVHARGMGFAFFLGLLSRGLGDGDPDRGGR